MAYTRHSGESQAKAGHKVKLFYSYPGIEPNHLDTSCPWYDVTKVPQNRSPILGLIMLVLLLKSIISCFIKMPKTNYQP
jgi:hypothetical protein